MRFRQGIEEKSRLGRLLVNRGYLSDAQVTEGLRLQGETGQRLGEVLVQAGWITEKELFRVLRHQSRYRNAAAVVTMVVLPFQPLVSFAASQSAGATQIGADAGEFYSGSGMAPMSDGELSAVAGQGDDGLLARARAVAGMVNSAGDGEEGAQAPDVIEGLKLTANVFVPVLNFLDSDLTISGVHYREGEPRYHVREDGTLTLAFPERIEQIRMDNIRVSGSVGPALGNVTISNVEFHPDSRMTIYTH